MIGSFTEVKPLYYWVQHILPLVYDDSLSYMELLGKVTKILNELVENNNLLPDYIMQLIKEYISNGEIEKVLSEVLANYMLNVKFPPKGLTPAVGDGSADDTEAIQGCIDYAYQNGGMAVYFPSGAYLTQPLTLNEKVTLFGQDRYTTRIVMKGGATKPLFTGTVDEMSLTGLGFDGNMDIQVNNVNLFTITVNSAIITNCLLTDGYDLLNITVNNELQLDNILFRHAVENALVVGGAGYVQGDNLIFKSLSTLIGKNYIILNTNKSILEEVKCFGAAPNGVLIGGNSNVVNMWCEACQTPYVDNGTNNTIHVYGASEDEKFTGDVTQYIGGFFNQTVVATKKLVARNVIDTAGETRQESTTGNKTETVNGNDTETVGGDKKETVSGSKSIIVTRSLDENIGTNKISLVKGTNTETITGLSTENANGGKVLVSTDYNENVINKNVTAAKIEETLTGNKTVTAANLTEIVAGDTTITSGNISATADNITFDVKATLHTDAQNTDINSKEATTFTGKDFKINTTEPLSYKTPTVLDRYFKSVPFKDGLGEVYNVLVSSDFQSDIINVKDKGAKGDGVTDDTVAIQLAFDTAMINGGGKVIFPAGTYNVSSTLIIRPHTAAVDPKGNQTIHFISMDRMQLEGQGQACIKATAAMDNVIRTYDYSYPDNKPSYSNFYTHISGLKIDGNNLAKTGIFVYQALHSIVDYNQIFNVENGISIYGYGELDIRNNVIKCSKKGIIMTSGGDSLLEKNDIFLDDNAIGVDMTAYSGSTLINRNTFTPTYANNPDHVGLNRTIGVNIYNGDWSDAPATTGPIHISNNSFDGVLWGVKAFSSVINKTVDIELFHNKLANNANYNGISLFSGQNVQNCLIHDNNVGVNYAYAGAIKILAELTNCNECSIVNNLVCASTDTPIKLYSCTNISVLGNSIFNYCLDSAAGAAIDLSGACMNNTIKGNVIRQNGGTSTLSKTGIQELGTSNYNVAKDNEFSGLVNTYYKKVGANSYFNYEGFGYAAPTTGTWLKGDVIRNAEPFANDKTFCWVCVTSGTPGVWGEVKWIKNI